MAPAVSDVAAIHAYCAVYTKPEVASAVLDGVGWTASADLRGRRLLEPAAGDGAFLTPAIERLLASARRHGFLSVAELSESVLAYEFEPTTALALQARVRLRLRRAGLSEEASAQLAKRWVKAEDFLLAKPSALFTDVVGNPPYMRWSKLPTGLRSRYEAVLPAHAAKGDLCLAFICRAVEVLAAGDSRVAFLCADRWLKCAYGEAARGELQGRVRVARHVEAHGIEVFAGARKVTTYAAVTVLDRVIDGGGVVARPVDLGAFLSAVRRPAQSRSRAPSRRLLRPQGGALLGDAGSRDALAAIIDRLPRLAEAGVSVRCGMALGCAPAFIVDADADIEPERLIPFVRSQDIAADGTTSPVKQLANVWDDEGALVDLDRWPRLAAHLEPFRADLVARACISPGTAWYRTIDRLHADRDEDRILVAGMARRSRVALSAPDEQPSNAVYILKSSGWPAASLFALLRSGLLDVFAAGLAPTFSGGSRRFDGNLLRQVRIPEWNAVSASLRAALEQVDPKHATARPDLVCDALRVRAADQRNAVHTILAAAWKADET